MTKVDIKGREAAQAKSVVIKVADLVAHARNEKPQIFGNLSDKKVESLVRLVIQQLGKNIEATQEGSIRVPGFGNFAVRVIEKAGAVDEKTTARRVVFRPMKAKEPEAKAES